MAHSLGIALSLGHTSATYEQANALIGDGVHCFTHLFNAMPPLHHRDGGAVAACLGSDVAFGEIICDGFHIAPHMVRQAFRLLGRERTVLVSDSMMGTGCPDGRYAIAGMDVDLRNGKAYTTDGAIAGSTLGLLDGVKNLMRFCQISLEEALCCATINPARAAKIDHMVGSLRSGLAADFLLLRQTDGNINIERIYVGGTEKEGIAS
jgi:N-acetylglucosamine-6-phosphate deacetylase